MLMYHEALCKWISQETSPKHISQIEQRCPSKEMLSFHKSQEAPASRIRAFPFSESALHFFFLNVYDPRGTIFLSLLKMSMLSIFNGPASLRRQPTLMSVPEVWLYSKNKEFSDTYFKRYCNLLDDFPQMNINIIPSFTEITEKQFNLIGNNIEQSPFSCSDFFCLLPML